jgi:hypothetical protein
VKNTQTPKFMEIHRMGADLYHADRHPDMTKPTVAFRNFANVRKEEKSTPEINEFAMLEPRGSTQVMAS